MGKEYINNKDFEERIAKFRATRGDPKQRDESEQIQLELAKQFYMLAENIIRAFKFQLVDKDEALQEGVLICFEKLHRFDPSIGKAFAFCTTIILNHFRQMYRSARHYHDLKFKYHKHLCESSGEEYMQMLRAKKNKGIFRYSPYSDGD